MMKTQNELSVRESNEKLEEQLRKVSSISYLQELLNALPNIVTILNDKRQVVYSNQSLLNQLNYDDFHTLLGKRPGEFIHCIHANECEGGCGTSEACKVCGSLNAILRSMRENIKVSEECIISTSRNGEEETYEFEATASPFTWEGERFTVFSLIDISSAKRRKVLERIFFHDLLNTAGNLKNLAEILPQLQDQDQVKNMIMIMRHLSDELVEEIEAQRQITSAENGDLKPKSEPLDSIDIIHTVTQQFSANPQRKKTTVLFDESSDNVRFNSDKTLLIRVLKNMLKNAVEASVTDEPITFGVHQKEDHILFYIHNNIYIPRKVQMQVFKRNFSTKGSDRGLGTYSMRLIGERYLKGRVFFDSIEETGTTFYFEIPERNEM